MNYKHIYDCIVCRAQLESAERLTQKKSGAYFERHHIKPKSIGGDNSKDNLVLLTPREHFICHALLVRFLTGTELTKMNWAFFRLCSCSKKNNPRKCGYVNARIYEKFKQSFQAGSNNSQYGKYWWVNTVTGESIKMARSPGDGWKRGRKLFTKKSPPKIHCDSGKYPRSNDLFLKRELQILCSGVNLGVSGWVSEVSNITKLTRQQIYKIYKKSEKLRTLCYMRLPPNTLCKRRQLRDAEYQRLGVKRDSNGYYRTKMITDNEWNERRKLVESCGVDLTKPNWIPQVCEITGLDKWKIYKMMRHFPDFERSVYYHKRNASLA